VLAGIASVTTDSQAAIWSDNFTLNLTNSTEDLIVSVNPLSVPSNAAGITLTVTITNADATIYANNGSTKNRKVSGSLDLVSVNLSTTNLDTIGSAAITGDPIAVASQVILAGNTTSQLSQGTWTGNDTITLSNADLAALGIDLSNGFDMYVDVLQKFEYINPYIRYTGTVSGTISLNYYTVPEIASLGMLTAGSIGLMLRRRK